MQLKHTKLIAAIGFALASIASAPVHAGALAMSDLNISSLFLASTSTGTPFTPGPTDPNSSIVIANELRRGAAGADYNGVSVSSSDLKTGVGVTLDATAVCAGPSCGTVAGSLYGGNYENNTVTHVAPPPSANYALGDVYIQGTAIGGAIKGITRSDAAAVNPTNTGGSSATLLNTATLTSNFTVGTSFAGYLSAIGDAYFRLQVASGAQESATATGGMGWNVTIRCTNGAASACSGLTGTASSYTYQPDEFNLSDSINSSNGSGTVNVDKSFLGQVTSLQKLNFVAGNTYSLTINQSSNVIVTSLPEPGSLALVGISMLGLGFAGYRRVKKG
ncbi:MAG: PEP-CTERM sorting domain-containing protein [Burkholderiales bacterium]|nr:PEP-CTERM sorting domain-containing protein [Burkholderiales bacterium]